MTFVKKTADTSKKTGTLAGRNVGGQGKQFLTLDEIKLIHRHFKRNIDDKKVPRKAECERVVESEPLLHGKT